MKCLENKFLVHNGNEGVWTCGGADRGFDSEQVSMHCGAGECRQHQNWRGMGGGRVMSRREDKKVSSEVCNILLALFSVLLLTILFSVII